MNILKSYKLNFRAGIDNVIGDTLLRIREAVKDTENIRNV